MHTLPLSPVPGAKIMPLSCPFLAPGLDAHGGAGLALSPVDHAEAVLAENREEKARRHLCLSRRSGRPEPGIAAIPQQLEAERPPLGDAPR